MARINGDSFKNIQLWYISGGIKIGQTQIDEISLDKILH
jgi:hypothetical protein